MASEDLPNWLRSAGRGGELDAAIREGAVQRVRPKAMTVAVILAGLLPILLGGGAGSEVMRASPRQWSAAC